MSAADRPTGPAIGLQDVHCAVDGRTVLQIDRLAIETGERVALIGSNGAGKSTLLRLLAGFQPPSRGSVEVLGQRLDRTIRARELRRLRCDVGQVFQGLHLVTRLTAAENVAIGALGRLTRYRDVAGSWFQWWTPDVRAAVRAALADTGMLALAAVPVTRLSGGERQKVAIARMLVQRPRLVLADEPTANLDPATAHLFGALLARFPADVTAISVVHDTGLIAGVATRVIGLKGGKVALDRPAACVDRRALDALYR